MGKTKAQIAEEVRNEHLDVAVGAADEELKEWSVRVFGDLKAADNALFQARSRAFQLDTVRKESRTAHRRTVNPETAAAWRESVTAAEEAQTELRDARDLRNRLQALSELLSAQLRQRRCEPDESNKESRKRQGTRAPAPLESCPFCEHTYTVRDGTLAQTDAEGNRLQLRKCQCREMAPPCKNCPTCKLDTTVMGLEGEEQLRICQEELRCQICACECPGAGKWIEGDEDSRERFKERTTKRHAELSALLNTSWSGGEGGKPSGGSGLHDHVGVSLRRLPADIKNQLEAAAAAESLQFSAFDPAAPSASGATSLGCGRVCCGETLATVKRRRLDSSNPAAAPAGVPRAPVPTHEAVEGCGDNHCTHAGEHSHSHHEHGHEHEHHHRHDYQAGGEQADNGGLHTHERHMHHEHHHTYSHDHDSQHHMHRCKHPHDECTSDCCSAVSQS